MSDRYRFKVLEVCEDLHSGANGSLESDRTFFQERYDWLSARVDTWFPSRCEFDAAVHNLVDLALFEAIAAMPWLGAL